MMEGLLDLEDLQDLSEQELNMLASLNFSQGMSEELLNILKHMVNETHLVYDETNYTTDPCDSMFKHASLDQTVPGYQIFSKTLLPIACVIGILGIIVTIMVLSRKSMVTSTNCYLISLAVADLGFLIILSTKLFEIYVKGHHFHKFDIYVTYANVFLHTFLLASVWLTVMLAIERYIAICHPLRAVSICTVCRARVVIVLIFVFSFYCRISNFFEQEVVILNPPCQEKIYGIALTKLGKNITYKTIYAWVVNGVLSAILPFIALVFLNFRLIVEIHRSTRYLRCHMRNDSSMQNVVSGEQIKITMMLISIILVFFVCQAPYVITVAYMNIHRYSANSFFRSETMNYAIQATIFALTLKSIFNFILYCWFSEKFRNTFRRMLCIKRCLKYRRNRKKNGHVIHSADQGLTQSARKTSCLTKDTIC